MKKLSKADDLALEVLNFYKRKVLENSTRSFLFWAILLTPISIILLLLVAIWKFITAPKKEK